MVDDIIGGLLYIDNKNIFMKSINTVCRIAMHKIN